MIFKIKKCHGNHMNFPLVMNMDRDKIPKHSSKYLHSDLHDFHKKRLCLSLGQSWQFQGVKMRVLPVGDGANVSSVGAASRPWAPCRPYEEKGVEPPRRSPQPPRAETESPASLKAVVAACSSSSKSHNAASPRFAMDLGGVAPASVSHAPLVLGPVDHHPNRRRGRGAAADEAEQNPRHRSKEARGDEEDVRRPCAYRRARGRRCWGLLLLLQRPPPGTCRAPPAEAAAGPVGLFVVRQPAMRAADVVVVGRSRTAVAGPAALRGHRRTAELLDARSSPMCAADAGGEG